MAVLFLALAGTGQTRVVSTRAPSGQVVATWIGGVGAWHDPAKWSGGVVPNNGTPAGTTYSVRIDGGNAVNSGVGLGASVTIDSLTIDAGDQLTIFDGRSLTVVNSGAGTGTITNAGRLALASSGGTTELRISGNVSLSGGGRVTLSTYAQNQIVGTDASDRLTNVDNTISGTGDIGGNHMALTNQGTIRADGVDKLKIDPSSDWVINSGTLRAQRGGTLQLTAGCYDNTGGLIQTTGDVVYGGSTLVLDGATVLGGTVEQIADPPIATLSLNSATLRNGTVTNAGKIIAGGSSTLGGTVSNPSGGKITVSDGATLVLTSGSSYHNEGDLSLASTGGATTLRISGDVSLAGGGAVTLSNFAQNQIVGTAASDRLTNVDNTISGAGNIGGNFMALTNQGTIHAGGTVQPNTLTIDPSATGMTTSGTVIVDPTATLATGSGDTYVQTADGTTTVNGNLVAGGPVSIQGGMLKGTGTITGDVSNSGGTVAPGASPGILTVTGTYAQTAGGTLAVEVNGLTAGTQYDRLAVGGAASLGGTLDVTTGFTTSIGQTFTILTAGGGRTGTFGTTHATGYTVQYNPNDVTLLVGNPPTAASVLSLTASRAARVVVLRWQTAAEVGVLGFDVWRFRNGKGVKVNRTLIRAKRSGEPSGFSYSFLDAHPGGRRGVSYRLQLVDLHGKRTWYSAFAIPG